MLPLRGRGLPPCLLEAVPLPEQRFPPKKTPPCSSWASFFVLRSPHPHGLVPVLGAGPPRVSRVWVCPAPPPSSSRPPGDGPGPGGGASGQGSLPPASPLPQREGERGTGQQSPQDALPCPSLAAQPLRSALQPPSGLHHPGLPRGLPPPHSMPSQEQRPPTAQRQGGQVGALPCQEYHALV